MGRGFTGGFLLLGIFFLRDEVRVLVGLTLIKHFKIKTEHTEFFLWVLHIDGNLKLIAPFNIVISRFLILLSFGVLRILASARRKNSHIILITHEICFAVLPSAGKFIGTTLDVEAALTVEFAV